ncbi:MAG: PhzF family phenazine biosynthesis protein, partial [Candidatus Heimdallarchaeota archaeon]|nr:PhzF family phenazine biosynthesis protein [Candidatus Heimdallarchaeota archaeon]
AANLTDQQMQLITKEFNFSESSFIIEQSSTEAKVRYFTPQKEIEYAGHPTIGTLYIIEMLYRKSNPARETFNLHLKGGSITGLFPRSSESSDLGIVEFEQKLAKFHEVFDDKELILKLLNLEKIDLLENHPFEIISVTSMRFLFVMVKSPETLTKITINAARLSQGVFKENNINVCVISLGGLDGGDFRMRFFVPLYGINEDPATGGIQSSVGLYLNRCGFLKNNIVNICIIEQGYEMGRPSKIYNGFEIRDGKLIRVITGGNCYVFSRGNIFLP